MRPEILTGRIFHSCFSSVHARYEIYEIRTTLSFTLSPSLFRRKSALAGVGLVAIIWRMTGLLRKQGVELSDPDTTAVVVLASAPCNRRVETSCNALPGNTVCSTHAGGGGALLLILTQVRCCLYAYRAIGWQRGLPLVGGEKIFSNAGSEGSSSAAD